MACVSRYGRPAWPRDRATRRGRGFPCSRRPRGPDRNEPTRGGTWCAHCPGMCNVCGPSRDKERLRDGARPRSSCSTSSTGRGPWPGAPPRGRSRGSLLPLGGRMCAGLSEGPSSPLGMRCSSSCYAWPTTAAKHGCDACGRQRGCGRRWGTASSWITIHSRRHGGNPFCPMLNARPARPGLRRSPGG